ncbi:MAG: ABC transporter ATP-binding protein [Anaerolineales bacterium]|nr:ABC transporter ATP-binding protein [Anaerolineales bacterium]
MTELAIHATGLRKQFGEKTAVANLTLQVKRGEIFGFLGPNGAGKTTSVKMLLGLTAPTAGSATLLGQPLGDRATRAKIGFLPEHFRFHEWLKAAEFLDLHGRLHQMPKQTRQQTIPELLELVGLQDRAQTPLRAFSKGMLQRIGLAQALLNDPALVFLDEPTSGLDPLGRRLVRDVINQLRQRGTAVFLNSHLLSEVEQTCDRVTFIRQGEILETVALNEIETAVPVTIRVGQPNGQLLADLAQFGNEATLGVADGRIHLTLPDEETLPKLAHWLTSQGHTLYELTPKPVTLEERFLQIVGDQSEG